MFEIYNENWYSRYVVLKRIEEGLSMIEKGKQHMIILLPYSVLFLLILGSVLIDFKLIDVFYLLTLTVVLIRYLHIKRNESI